jgi:hypothetical protein
MKLYLIEGKITSISNKTSNIALPNDSELVKSLFSSKESPVLVNIMCDGKQYEVKISLIEKDPKYGSRLVLKGYVKFGDSMEYIANYNWFTIREQP